MMIVLIGRSGAGKSTIAKALGIKLGYPVYEIGDYIKNKFVMESPDVNKKQAKAVSENRMKYVSRNLQTNGNLFFLKSMLAEIKDTNFILCGVRNRDELLYLFQEYVNVLPIGIQCEEKTLLIRYTKREQEHMSTDQIKDVFEKRRELEESMGVFHTIQLCKYTIDTSFMSASEAVEAVLKYCNEEKNI